MTSFDMSKDLLDVGLGNVSHIQLIFIEFQ